MFYSQFILAKKGPLGTIWIAAHLERKLRKNQVADTDIGVSVDSILFPDAPIALRLSSHLLLGVVRIYSKKVNYLFNDCSEALIKIKHAFRSAAVDLPPEESTAPYHSITLPENFDLDNFELPDSAFLDSNFVDHHVSTREQITLQDKVNDNAFPTSKFGLDERFGDEDASQIDLELDEELFMDKKVSPQHGEASMVSKVSGLHHGETSLPSTSMTVDIQFGVDEEKYNEIPNELSELLSNNFDKNCFLGTEDMRRDAFSSQRHGYTTQTPDLNEIFQPECSTALSTHIPFTPNDVQTPCFVEPAQEPSTPAILEEVVPSHLQEVPALSPIESGRPGSCTSPYMEIEVSEAGNSTIHAYAELDCKYGETAQGLPLSSDSISPNSECITPTCPIWNLTTDITNLVSAAERPQSISTDNELNNISTADHRLDNEEAINSSVFSHEAITLTSPLKLAASFNAEPVTSNICTDSMNVSGDNLHVAMKGSNELTEIANVGCLEDGHSLSTSVVGSDFLSRSCDSYPHLPSSPFLQTGPFEAEPASSNVSTDNMDVSGVNLELKRTPLKGNSENSNLGRGVGDSCLGTSMAGSDFLLRSFGSNLHPPSSFFVDGALGEDPELPLRDHCFSQKTPISEEVQHTNKSSIEVQGKDLHYTDNRLINLEGQNISGYPTSDFKHAARKPNEQLSMGVVSKVSHLDNEKNSSSSEILGPEKMLSPTIVDFPSYQVLPGVDKGVTPSDGIVGRNSSQFSRKRPLLDSATILQTSTAKLSEFPRTSSTDYILGDNDVLANILDGRTASSLKTGSIPPLSLKTGSIPPLSKPSSQKRPRTMPKVGLPRKRKVLVDDAMTLHADVIRQQLINTEDIRRMRKKAPCTRPEIWKIYLGAMEDDIFDRSVLIGVSVELNSSCNLKYDTEKDPSSLELNSQVKTSRDTGSSKVSEFGAQCDLYGQLQKLPAHSQVGQFSNDQASAIGSSTVLEYFNEIADKEIKERISSFHKIDGQSNMNASVTEQTHEVGAQYDHLQKLPVQPQARPFSNGKGSVMCAMHSDGGTRSTSIIQEGPIPEIGKSIFSEFSSDMDDTEMNETILSVPRILNRNFGPSSIHASPTLQTHEGGAHYDLYGQLNNLPVQPQMGQFTNDHAPVICAMKRDTETSVTVQPASAPNIVNRKFDSSSIAASATVQTHGGTHYDLFDQLNKLPVQPQVGSFSNDHLSVMCAMQPHVKTHPHSIIQETSFPKIDKSVSSDEKTSDKNITLLGGHNSQVMVPGGTGSSRFLEFPSEMSHKEMNERILSVPIIVNRNDGASSITASTTVRTNEVGIQYDLRDQLEKLPDQLEVETYRNAQAFLTCVTQPDIERQANSIILESPIPEIDKSISSVDKFCDKSINHAQRSPHNPQNTSYYVSPCVNDVDDGGAILNKQSRLLVDRCAELLLKETDGSAVVVDTDKTVEASGDRGKLASDVTCAEQNKDEGRTASDATCAEQNVTFFPSSVEHNPSTVGENSGIKVCNIVGDMDVDSMPLNIGAAQDSSDFCSAIDDNYTGFLNEDYEDADGGEAEDTMPNHEDAQSLENSGWSARTRGVARYLKNLFDEESGQGRTSIAVNRLLVGKTRKEASRMFFETLVLKTRDYIQVDQAKPFEHISITPRIKLLKSEF